MSWKPPKILIGAPTADVKNYCAEEWVDNVKSFLYPADLDIFLADNSDDPKNVDYLRGLGVDARELRLKMMKRLSVDHQSHNSFDKRLLMEVMTFCCTLKLIFFRQAMSY